MDREEHPLLGVLLAAAQGRFPPEDGTAVLLPPLPGGLEAVVSFTARAYVATARPAADLRRCRLDGYGAALAPEVLRCLAGDGGEVGVLTSTLAAPGLGGGALPRRHDLEDHPRVRYARSVRDDVRVHGDDRGLITLARGLAGRTEVSVEVSPRPAGQGAGRSLVLEALRLVPAGEPVFAAVAPGNARSLRAFLAVGFAPVGSEVLIRPAPAAPSAAPAATPAAVVPAPRTADSPVLGAAPAT